MSSSWESPGTAGGSETGASPYGSNPYAPNPYLADPYPSDAYRPAPYAPGMPPGPPAPVPYGGSVPYYPSAPPTSGLAIASLVCGLLGIVTAGLASIPAVVLGHLGLRETRDGSHDGRGLAIAGLVLGYLPLVGWLVFWLFWIVILVMVAATGSSVR